MLRRRTCHVALLAPFMLLACDTTEPVVVSASVSVDVMSMSYDPDSNELTGALAVSVQNTGDVTVLMHPCVWGIEREQAPGEWVTVYSPPCVLEQPFVEVGVGSTYFETRVLTGLRLGASATANWQPPITGDYRVRLVLVIPGGSVDESPYSAPFNIVLDG